MSFFDKFRKKQSESFRAIVSLFKNRPVWTDINFAKLAKEGYQRNPYVYACVREIALACAGIPWLLYRKKGDLVEVDDHPLLQLLKCPNPSQGQSGFIQSIVSFLMISGNAYVERVGPRNGTPKELYTLRPDRMKVIAGNSVQPIAGYEYKTGSSTVAFPPEVILHLKLFNPLNDWYGMSPLEAAARSVDQNNESKAWNVALLQNAARPSGALVTEGRLTDEQFEKLKKMINEKYASYANAGKPIILEGGLDWKEMSLNPSDMEWLEGQKLSAREIAIAFGVPPEMIGDTANKTYSNYQAARKAFYHETVLPLMDYIRDEFNNWLVPLFGEELHLDYDTEAIEALQEDRQKVWESVIGAVKAGVLTPNEAREMLGYEALKGADVLLVSATMLPLTSDSGSKSLDVKAFNLADKVQYWKSFEQQRTRWYPIVEKMVKERFNDEFKQYRQELFKAFEPNAAVERVVGSVADQEGEWLKLLKSIYLAVGEDFGKRVFDSFKAQYPSEVKGTFDVWQTVVLGWLGKEAAKKVKLILDTTREEIRRRLAEGVANGEGIPDLADRLDGLVKEIIPHRTTVIARTEVIAASNLGSRAAAKQTGLPLIKEWIATADGRTRDEHEVVNGQQRALDEPYDVGGEQLMFPGDTSLGASAWNVIQCRCTEGYYKKG